MKHNFLHAGDFFDDETATIDARFAPWVAGNTQASAQTLPDAVTANQGTAPKAGASLASSVVAVTTGGAPKQCHDAPNSRLVRLPGRGFGLISPVCAMLAQRLH